MKKNYSHLTPYKRDLIAIELAKGSSIKKISSLLEIHISTVYREIRRNSVTIRDSNYKDVISYLPSTANIKYLDRRKQNFNASKYTEDIKIIIENGLKEQLSFECIASLKRKTDKTFPCTRTIYNYRKKHLLTIPKNYRLKLKKRKSGSRPQSHLKKANTKHISQRPNYINTRRHFGHWELDLIESAGDGGYIITFIERMSRFTKTKYIDKKTPDNVHKFLKAIILQYPVYSITTDNGSEFNRLYELKSPTNNLEIYYTDPAAPHQKGAIEKFNKDLREFIKKHQIFTKKTSRKITYYTNQINNRPKKVLNYVSPEQIKNLYVF